MISIIKRGAYRNLWRSKRIFFFFRLTRPDRRKHIFIGFDWRRVGWSTFSSLYGLYHKVEKTAILIKRYYYYMYVICNVYMCIIWMWKGKDFTFASINLASKRSTAALRLSLVSAWATDSCSSFLRHSSSCSIIFSSAMADWVRKLLSWLRKSLFWRSTPTA